MIDFRSEQQAIQHLVTHVLTPDESHAWHIVWRESHGVLADDRQYRDQCYHLRCELTERLSETDWADLLPGLAGALMQSYRESIDGQYDESQQHGWYVQRDGRRVAMDTNGIYGVFAILGDDSTHVITAFLPGFGTSQGTQLASQNPADPHARVARKSRMRGDDDQGSKRGDTQSTRQRLSHRLRDRWTPEQRIYYLVFRSVVKSIRAWQPGLWSSQSPSMVDLKEVLPSMSCLSCEQWQELRQRQGGRDG